VAQRPASQAGDELRAKEIAGGAAWPQFVARLQSHGSTETDGGAKTVPALSSGLALLSAALGRRNSACTLADLRPTATVAVAGRRRAGQPQCGLCLSATGAQDTVRHACGYRLHEQGRVYRWPGDWR